MTWRILIVDDDVDALKLIGLMLEKKGYDIDAATTGTQGLEKALEQKPDLIILDVMMPDMDGYRVAQQLRKSPETEKIPILFFTAKTSINDKISGFQAGGDDYLTKPIHPAELISRVEALLQRSARTMAEEEQGKLIAFLPVKGGVGNSTLALNAALEFAKLRPDQKTVFVELKDGGGSAAMQVGMTGKQGVQSLIKQEGFTLTREAVEAQMIKHSSGLFILPSSARPAGIVPALTEDFVRRLLRILLTDYNFVLMDLPPRLDAIGAEVLRAADYVVISLEPNKIVMNLTEEMLSALEEMNIGRNKIGLVVVYRAPAATATSRKTIEEKFNQEIMGNIPPVPDLAMESWDRGLPLVVMQTQSLVAQQVRMIVESILKNL